MVVGGDLTTSVATMFKRNHRQSVSFFAAYKKVKVFHSSENAQRFQRGATAVTMEQVFFRYFCLWSSFVFASVADAGASPSATRF